MFDFESYDAVLPLQSILVYNVDSVIFSDIEAEHINALFMREALEMDYAYHIGPHV